MAGNILALFNDLWTNPAPLFPYKLSDISHPDPTDLSPIRGDKFMFNYHAFEGPSGLIFCLNEANYEYGWGVFIEGDKILLFSNRWDSFRSTNIIVDQIQRLLAVSDDFSIRLVTVYDRVIL